MIEFLFATAFTCAQGQDLIDNVTKSRSEYKDEIIDTIKLNTEPGCYEGSELNS